MSCSSSGSAYKAELADHAFPRLQLRGMNSDDSGMTAQLENEGRLRETQLDVGTSTLTGRTCSKLRSSGSEE